MDNSVEVRRAILREAESVVTGARADEYGSVEDSFTDIAAFWSIYLDRTLTSFDVAAMMILLKLIRLKTASGHVDSVIDIAGYAACYAACVNPTLFDELVAKHFPKPPNGLQGYFS